MPRKKDECEHKPVVEGNGTTMEHKTCAKCGKFIGLSISISKTLIKKNK